MPFLSQRRSVSRIQDESDFQGPLVDQDLIKWNAGTGKFVMAATGGGVTSVAATSPILSSGGATPTISFGNQNANFGLFGPTSGGAAAVGFRALVAADVPNLAASKITSGILTNALGGTGLDTSTAANGKVLIGTGTGLALANLTAGANVTITNGSGTITIASTGGGGGGLDVTTTNPTTSADLNDQFYNQLTITTDGSLQNPTFSNFENTRYTMNLIHGQNDVDGISKKTFFMNNSTMNARGCGQRIGSGLTINAYGGGDCFALSPTLNYACGITASGDEGQFLIRNSLNEFNTLFRSSISSISVAATINTTTTAPITRNINAQSIPVVSSTGVIVGQWVIVDPLLPGAGVFTKMEAVKVTAVPDGTHISGVFLHDHLSGAAVVPAVVLVMSDCTGWGEQRYIVNLTSSQNYSTGTAAGDTGTNIFTGAGTTWTGSIISGGPYMVGMIALTGDDVTASPFGAGASALKAWYPIAGVNDSTHLVVYQYNQAGIGRYNGIATSAGTYLIRPGARIMAFDGVDISSRTIVLSPNTYTWTVGDNIECTHSVSADVDCNVSRVTTYLNGPTYRSVENVVNLGLASWQAGYQVSGGPFGTAFFAEGNIGVGMFLHGMSQSAIYIAQQKNSGIQWGGPPVANNDIANNPGIFFDLINSALEINLLSFTSNVGNNSIGKITARQNGSDAMLSFTGEMQLLSPNNNTDIFCRINYSGTTSYWDLFGSNSTGVLTFKHTILGSLNNTIIVPNVTGTLVTLENANIFTVGPQTIQTGADVNKGFTIKANSGSQSGNLQEWQNNSGTLFSGVNNIGQIIMALSAGTPPGTPATGSSVYDTTNNSIWVYNAGWHQITGGGGSSPPFADNTTLVKNNADNTKLLILSAVNVTTGTTRTLTAQNANYTIAGLEVANIFTVGPQTIQTGADGNKGILVKANSGSQSGNLQEWQNNSGTLFSGVNNIGQIIMALSAGTPVGTPATGSTVYDTTANSFWVFNSTWHQITGGGGSSPPFVDNAALVKNNADNTKLLILSAVNVTTGTTRTLTAQNANYTIAGLEVANIFTVGPQTIQTGADGNKGILVKANSGSQSGNLQEWQNNSGTLFSGVNNIGQIIMALSAGTPPGTPATGSSVYDTTNNSIWVFNSTWHQITGGSSPPFADNTTLVKNSSDNTKLLILSAVNVTTGTTRTLTAQNANYTIAGLEVANIFTVGPQTIQTGADVNKGFIIKGNSVSQSGNLQEWQNSGGTPLASITPTGGGTLSDKLTITPPHIGLNITNTDTCAIQILDLNNSGILWGTAPAPGVNSASSAGLFFNLGNSTLEFNFVEVSSTVGVNEMGKITATIAYPITTLHFMTDIEQLSHNNAVDVTHRLNYSNSNSYWDIIALNGSGNLVFKHTVGGSLINTVTMASGTGTVAILPAPLSLGDAATDLDSAIALVNNIRTALINAGIGTA